VQQLLEYIITQEHAGYTEDQIRQALAGQGYTKQQIDEAFKSLGPSNIDPVIHEYVQQYARQGYPPVQIFSMLTQQGYAANKVRKSINEVFGPLLMPERHWGLAAFIAIAVIVALGGFYIIHNSGEPTPIVTGPPQELSTSAQITNIVAVAQSSGKDEAVRQCLNTLLDDDRDRCLMSVAITSKVNDNSLCDQIVKPEIHDACLLSFINQDFEGTCKRIKLRDNVDTCESLRALRTAKST
jgi:hypothetical protein